VREDICRQDNGRLMLRFQQGRRIWKKERILKLDRDEDLPGRGCRGDPGADVTATPPACRRAAQSRPCEVLPLP
jgi:hypothetical protein